MDRITLEPVSTSLGDLQWTSNGLHIVEIKKQKQVSIYIQNLNSEISLNWRSYIAQKNEVFH